MTQELLFKLIAITLLALLAHDINIISVGYENVKSVKSFVGSSAIMLQNIFNFITSPK